MCEHKKGKTSENDRRFLRSNRVAPFVCVECEAPKSKPKKIRLEEDRRDERREDDGA